MKNKTLLSILILYAFFLNISFASDNFVFNPTDPNHSLYIPEGKGPFPALLLLHASSGVEPTNQNWAKILNKQGYVVYVIDSFKPRNYIDRKSIGWDKATQAQLADVLPAKEYLATLPSVDKNRIGLIGFSMGAYTVLEAMNNTTDFKTAASFYPVCKRNSPDLQLKKSTQLFVGKKDDRSTFADCTELVELQHKNGHPTSIVAYPDALHGFDNPSLPASLEITDERNDNYHVGYNAVAQQQSVKDAIAFFKKTL